MLAVVGHLGAYFLLCSSILSVIRGASSREIALSTSSFRGHSAPSSLASCCNTDSSSDITLLLTEDSLSLSISFDGATASCAVIVASGSRCLQSTVTISTIVRWVVGFELTSFLLELVV